MYYACVYVYIYIYIYPCPAPVSMLACGEVGVGGHMHMCVLGQEKRAFYGLCL